MKRIFPALLCCLSLLVAAARPGLAQTVTRTAPADGDNLETWLLVVGPGPAIYSWWGHIGLVLIDTVSGREYFYDYGNFNFNGDNFIGNFAMGRLWFLMLRFPLQPYVDHALDSGRSVRMHRLDLPAAQKQAMREKLEWNYRPENRVYLYDHFDDNCATRIRDIIDNLVDGQLHAALAEPSDLSLRQLARQYADHEAAGGWVVDFLLSGKVDRPMERWDELFVPEYLEKAVLGLSYRDESGVLRPLVSESRTLFTSTTFADGGENSRLRYLVTVFLVILGLILPAGLLLVFKRHGWFDFYRALLLVLAAIPGSVLFFMMTFSDHDSTHGNWNILLASPLLLLIVPLTLWRHRRRARQDPAVRRRADRLALWFSAGLVGLGLLALLLGWLPAFRQGNAAMALNFLLPYGLFLWADWRRYRKAPTPTTVDQLIA